MRKNYYNQNECKHHYSFGFTVCDFCGESAVKSGEDGGICEKKELEQIKQDLYHERITVEEIYSVISKVILDKAKDMKPLTWGEVEKQGWNKALIKIAKIIHTSEMDEEEIIRVLDIIEKLKK
jgi:hypothetical protein